jgi:hypothetical protein
VPQKGVIGMRRPLLGLTLLLLLASGAFAQTTPEKERYLYVWAGDAARLQPDFLS